MIDIDFTNPVHLVRSNIGDPLSEYVTDTTIASALVQTNNDVIKASILLMETMLSYFLTQAELERTAQVEYEYKKLYERYKSRLQDFESKNASRYTAGIILGGVSLSEVNRVNSDEDSFNIWLQDTYNSIMSADRLVRDNDTIQD